VSLDSLSCNVFLYAEISTTLQNNLSYILDPPPTSLCIRVKIKTGRIAGKQGQKAAYGNFTGFRMQDQIMHINWTISLNDAHAYLSNSKALMSCI